jgi:hypothetical protein
VPAFIEIDKLSYVKGGGWSGEGGRDNLKVHDHLLLHPPPSAFPLEYFNYFLISKTVWPFTNL